MSGADWVGTAELGRLLGVSRDYIQRQCAGQHWPHRRIGRRIGFAPDDVAWVVANFAVPVVVAAPEPVRVNRPRRRYPDSVA